MKQENIKCEDLIKQNTNQLKIEGELKKEISDRESQRKIMENEIIELKKLVEESKSRNYSFFKINFINIFVMLFILKNNLICKLFFIN